jgi:hypothetical protein
MSTPISQIRRGGAPPDTIPQVSNPMQSDQPPIMIQSGGDFIHQPPQNENELVEDILREINGNPGDSNINGGAFEYATDQAQVPAGPPPARNMDMTDKMIEEEYRNFVRDENRLISKLVDTNQHPWVVSVVNGLVVFLILLIVSLPQVNKFIFTFLPGLLLESGQVSFQGVLLKCVIGLILYVVITTVVL